MDLFAINNCMEMIMNMFQGKVVASQKVKCKLSKMLSRTMTPKHHTVPVIKKIFLRI